MKPEEQPIEMNALPTPQKSFIMPKLDMSEFDELMLEGEGMLIF